jgi:hypothetical protein
MYLDEDDRTDDERYVDSWLDAEHVDEWEETSDKRDEYNGMFGDATVLFTAALVRGEQ